MSTAVAFDALSPAVLPEPALLAVDELRVSFQTRGGVVEALRGVSFDLARGETLALVGESGSGKSVACLAIMNLLDPNARIDTGGIRLAGNEIGGRSRRSGPADGLSMIFQYPRTALNPIRRVGRQISDVLAALEPAPRRELRRTAVRLLEEVRISDAERRFDAYPFELSGGQCQRVLIAMALARRPKLLIADEPTTGLDVVTQRAIMQLIGEARKQRGMSTILVTHDLGLACEWADRVVVMKKGEVVETATCRALFERPRHAYTRALLAATPGLSRNLAELRRVLAGGAS